MVASHGDGSLGGGIHEDNFLAIAQYFQQRSCRNCEQPYAPEGIEFVRQEPGVVVVKVGCASCGRPLGIALVGMNNLAPAGCAHEMPMPKPIAANPRYRDWSKRDTERLEGKPPINYDDVLSAHEFFGSLGADWARFLPKSKRRTSLRTTG